MNRVFLLPGLVLLVTAAAYGHDLWDRFYQPVREYCEVYFTNSSVLAHALPIVAGVIVLAIAGGAVRLALHLKTDGVLSRRIRNCTVPESVVPARVTRRARVRAPIVCIEETAPFAFCRGFVRPTVYVSTGLIDLLDEEELAVVMAHEGAHARRRDPLRAMAARALAGSAFFLPIARPAEERYLLSLEFAADREAAKQVSWPQLASALLKLLEIPRAGAFAGGRPAINPTEERIRRLTRDAGDLGRSGSCLRALSRTLVWSAASGLLSVAVIAFVFQAVSSMSRCPDIV